MDPAPLAPLSRAEPIAERVYRELRSALLRRAIVPGERLVEADLAQRLGVSRTPVREALARLQSEDMVEAHASGGLVARDVGAELEDIYGLRQVLEGYAARLAAARITAAEIERLEGLSRELRAAIEAGDHDRHVEINNAFHLAIARAARSTRLLKMIADLRAYFLTSEALNLYDRAALLRSHAQHEAIVRALHAGDGEAAERLVRAHFHDAMDIVLHGTVRQKET